MKKRSRRRVGGALDPKRARKEAQLRAQAQRALALALASLPDEALAFCWLAEVHSPAPGMLVAVVATEGSPTDVEAALLAHASALRRAVADAITRKKVPELSFVVTPMEAWQ